MAIPESLAQYKPTIEEWLALPQLVLARYVRDRNLSVMLSVDGTRRHYLLNRHAASVSEIKKPTEALIDRFEVYAQAVAVSLARSFELLFSLGVQTVLTLPLLPSNFLRPANYLQLMLEQSQRVFLGPIFSDLYHKYDIQARLFGDYDISPNAKIARPTLEDLAQRLELLTPSQAQPWSSQNAVPSSGEWISENYEQNQDQSQANQLQNLLLLGFYGSSFVEEIIRRTQNLSQASATTTVSSSHKATKAVDQNTSTDLTSSAEDELRKVCFPYGPTRLDILICAGWLKVGGMIPPLLDGGVTDIYNLSYLTLDLQEDSVRRILYDHLFLRNRRSDDDLDYTPQDLEELKAYYAQHRGGLIGVGRVVGPGVWYAEHP